jgi:hypothetical protein
MKIRRRVDVSAKNWQRVIIYEPEEDAGQEPVRGLLVGCSDDQATAFIRIRPTPKRTRVIAMPTEHCHFARRKQGEEMPAMMIDRDLPLFGTREDKAGGIAAECDLNKAA